MMTQRANEHKIPVFCYIADRLCLLKKQLQVSKSSFVDGDRIAETPQRRQMALITV